VYSLIFMFLDSRWEDKIFCLDWKESKHYPSVKTGWGI
jgi:hypothetical protein